jgi:hypothetical protein
VRAHSEGEATTKAHPAARTAGTAIGSAVGTVLGAVAGPAGAAAGAALGASAGRGLVDLTRGTQEQQEVYDAVRARVRVRVLCDAVRRCAVLGCVLLVWCVLLV